MTLASLTVSAKTLVRDLQEQFRTAQILLVASSLAYTTILSIIPLLAVSFAIFKAFGGLDRLYAFIQPIILENLAESAGDEVIALLKSFIENAHASAIGIGGLFALILTSMSMLSSAEKAIHRVWGVPLNRSFFHRIATYWLFITLGPIALAVIVGFASSSGLSGLQDQIPLASFLPGGAGAYGITTFLFFMIYKAVPTTKVRWDCALIPALGAAAAWFLAKAGYSIYVTRFVAYNRIYGSLGAVPILLLWIYIAWIIVLSGAAVSATLQKRNLVKIPKLSKLVQG